jgi:hypothetical protein
MIINKSVEKNTIIKITTCELLNLCDTRTKLYDGLLLVDKNDNKINITIVQQINLINNIIEFYNEINRFIFNIKLSMNIEYKQIDEEIYYVFIDFIEQDKKTKLKFILPTKYVGLNINNSNVDNLRNELEWIKLLKISTYIDKLKQKFQLKSRNKINLITNTINLNDSNDTTNNLTNMIDEEISHYIELISHIYANGDNKTNFYLKGGFVIGFKIIQIIWENIKITNMKITPKQIILDTLEFVRDFDIVMCIDTNNYEEYNNKLEKFILNELTNKYFRKEGQVVIVLRDKNNLKTLSNPNESFIELSVKNCISPHDTKHLIDLEIPLTSMIIHITQQNLLLIFQSIIKSYYRIYKEDELTYLFYFDLVEKINLLPIQIYSSTPMGLFDTHKSTYSNGVLTLGKLMIDTIEKTSYQISQNNNINTESIKQFLASSIIQPDRLFIRLICKNITKSLKSKLIMEKYLIDTETINWLLDKDFVIDVIDIFLTNLSEHYIDWNNVNISDKEILSGKKIAQIEKILFTDCNLGRLIGEIDKISNSDSLDKMEIVYLQLKKIFGKNHTQYVRNHFNPKDQSNLVRVQKSYDNLVESLIWKKYIQ